MNYLGALECAVECARTAGVLLLEEARRPSGPRGSGAHADADTEAESIIEARLNRYFPNWGYLGEELGYVRPESADGHLWVVDPNDATSAFLRGLRGPSVSIALLHQRTPVLGVVFAYTAPDDNGDLIFWARNCGPLIRNGCAVTRSWPQAPGAEVRVLVSVKSSETQVRRAEAAASPMQIRQTPSIAYRMALVASGEADLTFSATDLQPWDYAAGHALVRAAGGMVCAAGGALLTYDLLNRSIGARLYAGGPALVQEAIHRWR